MSRRALYKYYRRRKIPDKRVTVRVGIPDKVRYKTGVLEHRIRLSKSDYLKKPTVMRLNTRIEKMRYIMQHVNQIMPEAAYACAEELSALVVLASANKWTAALARWIDIIAGLPVEMVMGEDGVSRPKALVPEHRVSIRTRLTNIQRKRREYDMVKDVQAALERERDHTRDRVRRYRERKRQQKTGEAGDGLLYSGKPGPNEKIDL